MTIGVPLTTLDERLGSTDAGDTVALTVDMKTRHLRIEYRNVSQSIALIDPDAIRSEPDNPDLDLPNRIVIEGRAFAEAVTVADHVSDHCSIEGRPDDREAAVTADGDTDEAEITFDDETCIDASVDAEATSLFPLDYLADIASPMPDSAEVTVRWGDEFPMRLTYEGFDGALTVEAMQAPRIQRD